MTESVLISEGRILVYDGVGLVLRGDTCIVVYQKAAQIKRTRWLFDVVETILSENAFDILAFMIVLPSADPPDAPTRHENTERLRKIGHRVRRLVTTPIGNAFKINLVRAIMRGMNVILGHSGTRFVTDTVEDGIAHLLEAKSARTPSASQILSEVTALYRALGEPEPRFPSARPADS